MHATSHSGWHFTTSMGGNRRHEVSRKPRLCIGNNKEEEEERKEKEKEKEVMHNDKREERN